MRDTPMNLLARQALDSCPAPRRLYYRIINRFFYDLIKICLDFIDYDVLLEHQNDIIFMIYYGHKMLFPFGIKPSPCLRQVIR